MKKSLFVFAFFCLLINDLNAQSYPSKGWAMRLDASAGPIVARLNYPFEYEWSFAFNADYNIGYFFNERFYAGVGFGYGYYGIEELSTIEGYGNLRYYSSKGDNIQALCGYEVRLCL